MPTDAETLCARGASRLAAWLSPAFPIGGFSYSHGLETAVETGVVRDEASLRSWLRGVLRHGSGRADAILLANAWRTATADTRLREVAELAAALRPGAELARETEAQGRAFLDTLRGTWPHPLLERLHGNLARWELPIVLPVAVGVACRAHALPLVPCLALHLHAFAANGVSAGVRLVPLGQTAGQRVTAALEDDWIAVAHEAAARPLAAVASAVPRLEILSMQHEHQHARLFRS